MKKELDPKIVGGIIAVVVVIAGGGLFMATKGQADRSGPLIEAKWKGGTGAKGMPGGWRPGMVAPSIGSGGTSPAPPGSGGNPPSGGLRPPASSGGGTGGPTAEGG